MRLLCLLAVVFGACVLSAQSVQLPPQARDFDSSHRLRARLAGGISDNVRREDEEHTNVVSSGFNEAESEAGYAWNLGFANFGLGAHGRYRAIWIDRGADIYDSSAKITLRRMASPTQLFGFGIEFEGGYERQRYYEIFPAITRQHNLRLMHIRGRADVTLRHPVVEFSAGAFGRYNDFSEERRAAFFAPWWATGVDAGGKPRDSFDNWIAGGDAKLAFHSGKTFSILFWGRLSWQRFREQFELSAELRYPHRGRLQQFEYAAGTSVQLHLPKIVEFEVGGYYRHYEEGREVRITEKGEHETQMRGGNFAFFPVVSYLRLDVNYQWFALSTGFDAWLGGMNRIDSRTSTNVYAIDWFRGAFGGNGFVEPDSESYFHYFFEASGEVAKHFRIGARFEYTDRASNLPNTAARYLDTLLFVEFKW